MTSARGIGMFEGLAGIYQPAVHKMRGLLVPRLLYIFCIFLSVYHVRNNYVTYVVAMQLSRLWMAALSTGVCVATMSNPAQKMSSRYREAEATQMRRRKA